MLDLLMNLIDQLFGNLHAGGRKAFMPFLTAGDPDLTTTERLLNELVARGSDLVEIGFPYSDPIADGPVIQASYTRALAHGVKLDRILEFVKRWTQAHPAFPLVAMVSCSIIMRRGPKAFLERARSSGFSGLIVPDLPVEESASLANMCRDHDLKLIQLITPTTPRERAVQIARQSTGFIYYVSVTGITGTRDRLPPELRDQLAWLRTQTDLPICVGFGISKPEHAAMLKDVADGIIVGSAIVRKLDNLGQRTLEAATAEVGELATSLRRALD
jgi:tryptophan synthase alpha chain